MNVRSESQPPRTALDAVARYYNLSDAALALKVGGGLKRNTVQARRAGDTQLRTRELGGFSDALHVPVDVLLMSPTDALRWIIDHEGATGR